MSWDASFFGYPFLRNLLALGICLILFQFIHHLVFQKNILNEGYIYSTLFKECLSSTKKKPLNIIVTEDSDDIVNFPWSHKQDVLNLTALHLLAIRCWSFK